MPLKTTPGQGSSPTSLLSTRLLSEASATGSASARSSASSELLDLFKKKYGRDPTAAELAKAQGMSESSIRSYLSSTPASTGSSGSGASSGSTPVKGQTGYGGMSTWDAIKKYGIRDDNENAMSLPLTGEAEFAKLNETFDKLVGGSTASIEKLDALNQPLLEGKLPDDLTAQIRRAASERAMTTGVFGQAARATTARDLGTTSLALRQQGLENQAQIESIRDTVTKTIEAKRQFQKQWDLNVNQFKDTVRQRNLQGVALEQERLQFNAENNIKIMTLMSDLVKAQQEIGFSYSAKGVEATESIKTFDSYLASLRSYLT